MCADLARVADDLDHIRRLGIFGPGRQQTLKRAAAELRALPALIAENRAQAAELARLRKPISRDANLPAVVSPAGA